MFVFSVAFLGYRYVHSDAYYLVRVAQSGDATRVLLRDVPGIAERTGADSAVSIVGAALDQKIIGTDDCHLIRHLVGHTSSRINDADFDATVAANRDGMERSTMRRLVTGMWRNWYTRTSQKRVSQEVGVRLSPCSQKNV